MRKLLRTIRLDPSDTFVFPAAAAPGEWAVPGTFQFWDADPAVLAGKDKQAFRSGFLGVDSFGWSTLAVVVEATEDEYGEAVHVLANRLLADHGAPDLDAALAAASEEIAAAEELAQHPVQTLVAVARKAKPDGSISEQFRTFQVNDRAAATSMPCSAGAFAIVDDDGALAAAHDEAVSASEHIDLSAMIAARTAGSGGGGR